MVAITYPCLQIKSRSTSSCVKDSHCVSCTVCQQLGLSVYSVHAINVNKNLTAVRKVKTGA
uniref:BLTX546 n=1 Tax=Nephila pilipes TaxID=299642 RepID=A0A076KU69_NEPPI|nr:BLTX546 [Nephila pilipes]